MIGDVEEDAGRQDAAVTRQAGRPSLSAPAVLSGALTTVGLASLLVALVLRLLLAATSLVPASRAGLVTTAAVSLAVLAAFLYGGYTTGRMARRAGALNGVVTALMILAAVALAVFLARLPVRPGAVVATLDRLGVADGRILTLTAVVLAVAAIVTVSALGGTLGCRWHTKLARRAARRAESDDIAAHTGFLAEETERDRTQEPERDVRRTGTPPPERYGPIGPPGSGPVSPEHPHAPAGTSDSGLVPNPWEGRRGPL